MRRRALRKVVTNDRKIGNLNALSDHFRQMVDTYILWTVSVIFWFVPTVAVLPSMSGNGRFSNT
jgi:hypothetical protein